MIPSLGYLRLLKQISHSGTEAEMVILMNQMDFYTVYLIFISSLHTHEKTTP